LTLGAVEEMYIVLVEKDARVEDGPVFPGVAAGEEDGVTSRSG